MKRFFSFFMAISLLLGLFVKFPVEAEETHRILSSFYGVDWEKGVLGVIPQQTDETELLSRIYGEGELTLSDGVKTGSRLNLCVNGETVASLAVAVQADCNADGSFSVSDLLLVKSLLLGLQEFDNAQTAAADVSGDGKVSVTDFLQMKSQILGISEFSQQGIANTYAGPSVAMAPGEQWAYPAEAGAVTVDGSAAVWADGMIIAQAPGTALLHAGSQEVLITVCQQPVEIAFQRSEYAISPNSSAQLSPQLSMPLSASITYAVSDPSVLTVDETGRITGVSQGTAVVTATLLNGKQASQTVRVMPLIETITLSQSSLKVKHEGGIKSLSAVCTPEGIDEKLVWSSSDPSVATVDQNGVITGVKDGYVTIRCTSEYGQVSASCRVKVCNLVQVALTFDDGPSKSYTGKVLDTLETYDVTSTFFMVGENLTNSTSDIVIRMAQDGHELGYHTMEHTYFYNMTSGEIKADYEQFQTKLEEICGQRATLFRAPGGGINNRALEAIPLPHIMWSVDTRDWETRNAQKVKEQIISGVKKDGAIILVHDIHKTTYEGVVLALKEIRAEDMDVEFLTVTELLSRDGTPPEAGKTYYYD